VLTILNLAYTSFEVVQGQVADLGFQAFEIHTEEKCRVGREVGVREGQRSHNAWKMPGRFELDVLYEMMGIVGLRCSERSQELHLGPFGFTQRVYLCPIIGLLRPHVHGCSPNNQRHNTDTAEEQSITKTMMITKSGG